jgi:hypothetical protein
MKKHITAGSEAKKQIKMEKNTIGATQKVGPSGQAESRKSTVRPPSNNGGLVLFLIVILACVWGVWWIVADKRSDTTEPLPMTAETSEMSSATEVAGIWQAESPTAGAAERATQLLLDTSGVASFMEDYQNGEKPLIRTGRWELSEENGVTVTLSDAEAGAGAETETMNFVEQAGELVLVDYDLNEWGSAGLKLKKLSALP